MHLLFVTRLFSDAVTNAICWTLLHSIWQGLILAVIAGIVLIFIKKSSPAARYNVLTTLFFAYQFVLAYTFVHELRTTTPPLGVATGADVVTAGSAGFAQPAYLPAGGSQGAFLDRFIGYFNTNAGLIVTIWFIIFCALVVKMLASLVYTQRIRHYKIASPAEAWKEKLAELGASLRVNPAVRLLESGVIKAPMTIGFLKPLVLVPIGLLANLPPEDVESILAHELAHIKRRDYFVNLCQVFIETALFFNPGLLWISSLIRQEREVCCDELAVSRTRSRRTYVNALVSFQQYYLGVQPHGHAMAFAGKKNHLLDRVKRLMTKENHSEGYLEKITMVCCIVMIIGTSFLFSGNLRAENQPVQEKIGRHQTAPVPRPVQKDHQMPADTVPRSRSQEVKFPDVSKGEEETYLNTVTTTDSGGTRYKLTAIGDRLPKFYVNDELVPRAQVGRYSRLITKLQEVLLQRQKQDAEERNADLESGEQDYEERVASIVDDLIKENVVKSKADLSSFRLSSTEFTVNDQKMTLEVFNRFKKKYIRTTYDVYKFNSPSR